MGSNDHLADRISLLQKPHRPLQQRLPANFNKMLGNVLVVVPPASLPVSHYDILHESLSSHIEDLPLLFLNHLVIAVKFTQLAVPLASPKLYNVHA